MRKIADAPRDSSSLKADQSHQTEDGLSAWDFTRVGLVSTLIAAAVVLVVAVLGRITSDTVPVALFVFAMLLIAIWGGLTLVAVPTLLVRRMRRAWASSLEASRGGYRHLGRLDRRPAAEIAGDAHESDRSHGHGSSSTRSSGCRIIRPHCRLV